MSGSDARLGVKVCLYEMRPMKTTGAHRTGNLAELVCSNSFKSNLPHTASGELKREMRLVGSLVLDAAARAAIPAGEALAVDRDVFSGAVQEALEASGVEILREEIVRIPEDGVVIVATGPLTSDHLAGDIARVTGESRLFFYDAVAPIVETESIDFNHCWEGSRYDKGDGAYLNCPLSEELYFQIVQAIVQAETVPLHSFEDTQFFEGCLPLEEIARRGALTLAHGPWKPVGLNDPRTGQRAFAVLQLRRENAAGTCYSLVACQTRMTWPAQREVFRMIPALAEANFLRLGVVHRNTYLNSPLLLDNTLQLKSRPGLFFAGQIVGVEGYLESAAAGMAAGINAAGLLGYPEGVFLPPEESMLGALLKYVAEGSESGFAPMNANFGIMPPLEGRKRRRQERRAAQCDRAFESFSKYWQQAGFREALT